MATTERDIPYLLTRIETLVGFKITRPLTDDSDSFGFLAVKGAKTVRVWVDRDAEGNGPGWISIEEVT